MKTKRLWIGLLICGLGLSQSFASDYRFYYEANCEDCENVVEYFERDQDVHKLDIETIDINLNTNTINQDMEKAGLDKNNISLPLLMIDKDHSYITGSQNIISYLTQRLNTNTKGDSNNSKAINTKSRASFFLIMLPAAISDSINPCAFAVMFLLLNSILSKHKSRRKTILAGLMFSLAVFATYFAMGVGLFSALASATNVSAIKIFVGVLGILVGLANIKDYFWYGKGFVMEVPFSRRPKMADLIDKVSSPRGAFAVGVLISLFLLPCSSGPYFTILGYLSAESKDLNTRGYIYLTVYNLIFVLPMFLIAIAVGMGYSSVDKLAKIKHKNTKLIHLIVGLLMLGLGIYVLATM